MELVSLLPEYQRHLVALDHRPRGIARYVQHLQLFFDDLPERAGVEHLTPAAVRRHMRERSSTCASATVLGMLTAVRSFSRYLIEEGLLDIDPTTRVQWPRRKMGIPRSLTPSELQELLDAIRNPPARLNPQKKLVWQRNRRAIYLMLYAGLRLEETAALRWADVDFQANTIIVRDGKGGKQRLLPLHPRLRAELLPASGGPSTHAVAGRIDGEALSGKVLAQIFERWLPRQGITGIHAHRLRHTFATEMLQNGAALPDIQEAMGHADIGTTRIYLRVDIDRVRSAVGLLPNWE